MAVFVFTLGWDEKFQIRSILRNGVKEGAKVIVILAEPLDKRSEEACQRLEKFVREYIPNSQFDKIIVNPVDIPNAISKIIRKLKEYINDNVIVNISGGLRALIVVTLLAVLSLNLNVKIEVELENFQGVITFYSSIIEAKELDEYHLKILKLASKESISISDVQLQLKIPRSTSYKKLEELLAKGFLSKRYESAIAYYEITQTGKIALAIRESIE